MQIGVHTFKRALPYARFDLAGEHNGLYDREEIFKHILSVLNQYRCKHSDPQVVASPFKKHWKEVFERVDDSHGVYRFRGFGRDKWLDDEPERQFGEGSYGAVYAWCHPQERNKSMVSIKVGHTTMAVRGGRVSKTNMPTAPYVLALIRCSNAEEGSAREEQLQGFLRDRQIRNGGGTEWFETSADALFSAIRTCFPQLAEIVRVA